MPVVTVFGILCTPPLIENAGLVALILQLRRAVASITELCLKERQVTVFFPQGISSGDAIVCFIDGLFVHERRTPEVHRKLAEAVKAVLENFRVRALADRPEIELVEVFVRPFSPQDGYAST